MTDFNVVGAGPVGSYCANLLVRSGFSVHLTDTATFPRDKLCGGGLTKKSLDLIQAIEPGFRTSGVPEFVHDFELVQPESLERQTVHIDEDWVALVHRREFDDWMRQRAMAAGATFSAERVPARFVVAADGAGSKLGKEVRGTFASNEIAIATECTVPNRRGPYISVILNPSHNPADLGYAWVFARSDTAQVGTGVLRSFDRNLPRYKESVCRAVEHLYGIRTTGFTNWVIPLYRHRPAHRGNVVAIGDALGTADPLFVEGIASGLYSAKVLVDSFRATGGFSTYAAALAGYPYFRDLRWIRGFQRRGNSDFAAAFRLFALPGELRELIELISGFESPRDYAKGLVRRHPFRVLRAWLRSVGERSDEGYQL